jgi:hypothetical protein
MFMPNKVTVTNEDGSTTDFFPQSCTDAAVAAVTPVVANPIIEPGVAYTAGGNSAAQMLVLAPSAVTVTPRVYLASAAQAATAARYAGVAQGSASVGGSVTAALGGIDSNHGGLSIGTQYYLSNTPGAVSASAGAVTRKVGIATDVTKLLITNIW